MITRQDYEDGFESINRSMIHAWLLRLERQAEELRHVLLACSWADFAKEHRRLGNFDIAAAADNEARAHGMGYLCHSDAERFAKGFNSYAIVAMFRGDNGRPR